jgi:hypothetical protein
MLVVSIVSAHRAGNAQLSAGKVAGTSVIGGIGIGSIRVFFFRIVRW